KGLCIIVEDNGKGTTDEGINELNKKLDGNMPNDEITGILNIHKRLQLKFGRRSGVAFARSGLGGAIVTISIILEEVSDNVQNTRG
ncbi:MAG: two-component sensor histidine kinase, partial [Clostridiales bacterium]|nr:two-component sensor histidine kinase [Clostridiales bacterium]